MSGFTDRAQIATKPPDIGQGRQIPSQRNATSEPKEEAPAKF